MKIAAEKILTKNVDNGAEWLDENHPDWYTKIDLSNFDMSSGRQCICGHLFKDKMYNGLNNGYDYFVGYVRQDPVKMGFVYDTQLMDVPDDGFAEREYVSSMAQYSFLAELWVEKIEKRLANDGKLA